MHIYHLIGVNLFNLPLICFFVGIGISFFKSDFQYPERVNKELTRWILLCIGLKGGVALAEHFHSMTVLFLMILGALIAWGFVQPVLAFFLLKRWTRVDCMTAGAIAASFGSVSVMTFVTGLSFLEHLGVGYREEMIIALAIMEVPAIISGLFLVKRFGKNQLSGTMTISRVLFESLFNQAIVTLLVGLGVGAFFYAYEWMSMNRTILSSFTPCLCLFLLDMGMRVGQHRKEFRSFSWQLNLFAIYMPLIGGGFGLLLSYLFGMDRGTATLIAILGASASYIAVPAAMRVALPQAKEAIYLPLSLGIAFPFNIAIGIPLYYHFAHSFL